MINKRRSFAMDNVTVANRAAFRQATGIQSGLDALAFDFSVFPRRPVGRGELGKIDESRRLFNVMRLFKEREPIIKHMPDDQICHTFVHASEYAHRLESSLMTKGSNENVLHPLVLTLKFYYKEERAPFFEWQMTFDDFGRLYRSSATGHGVLGKRAFQGLT